MYRLQKHTWVDNLSSFYNKSFAINAFCTFFGAFSARLSLGVYLLKVLVHGTPVGENSFTKRAGKLFAIMQGFSVSFQIRLSPKSLSTFRARVDFLNTRVLFFSVAEQASFALE
jgi:hypothetical protein